MNQGELPTSALADLPSWARIVALVGVPSVLACFLVYQLSTTVGAQVTAAADGVKSVHAKLDVHVTRMEQLDAARDAQMDDMLTLLRSQERLFRLICAAVSKTPEEQRKCFDP